MKIADLRQLTVSQMGFESLNEMQEKMLEEATSGKNILLLSPTGSGKTIAFLLPLIMRLHEGNSAMIIVPSRELAIQIQDVFKKLKTEIQNVCCYGGHDMNKETDALAAIKPHEPFLIIGTTGRLKDHIERGNINVASIKVLVLDEYDKSLELGFEEELRYINAEIEQREQLILTSATHAMPFAPWLNFKDYKQLDFLAKTNLKDENTKYALNEKLRVFQIKSPIADKLETLKGLLSSFADSAQVIVFSNYRESSERISHYLTDNGIENALYHGGLEQEMREKALARFRGNSLRVLVSTDLASRGLDIPDVAHIIHYHLPTDEEAFVHRNGRTARAGNSGAAYLIIGPNEFLPAFLKDEPPYFKLKSNGRFQEAPFVTVYIGRGKKDKISKGDLLGFFTKNGGIEGNKIGRIDIYEKCAYCSISRDVAQTAIEKVKGLKIKGEKTHYLIVK